MSTQEAAYAPPAHVPAELYFDRSMAEFCSELDDPYIAASRLLDGPPVFWTRAGSQGRPTWVIARHALIKQAYVDWEHFSSEGSIDLMQALGVDWDLNPVKIDPPRHTLYRKLLMPFFTPRAVSHLEDSVRETVDELIGKLAGRQGCDFVSEFAIPFPSYIFLTLMGMPRDMLGQFFQWEQDLLRGTTIEQRLGAGRNILDYLRLHLEQQKRQPATPLMEGIMQARIEDGRALDDGEVLGMFYTFYVGGLDTVYATLSWAMRHIAGNPEFQQFLRDNPEQMPRAVDEMLRMFSVVSSTRRVTRDLTFHGVEMHKDDPVLLPLYVGCRDPEAYPDPHEARLDRKEPMLAFASGPHLCLGMHLARREIRIALEQLLARFDNIHIPSGAEYTYHVGPTLNVDSLPLAWTPR